MNCSWSVSNPVMVLVIYCQSDIKPDTAIAGSYYHSEMTNWEISSSLTNIRPKAGGVR